MKINKRNLFSLLLLLVLKSNYLLTLPAIAQATQTGVTPSPPASKIKETLLTGSFPTFTSVNPSFPVLDTQSRPAQDSAFIRTPPIVQKLLKKQYRSGEDISFAIANPQDDLLSVSVVDNRGQQADVAIAHIPNGNETMYDVSPRAQFRPGKYKLVVTDASGRRSEQDFSWGVLSINSDRSVYLPGQTADLAMAVLDDEGNMVCDAKLDLKITTATASASDVLSTGNGKITVNPQCQSHKFALSPDYEAHYLVGASGTYNMSLTAQTKSGSYTISDQLIVQDAVPFDVQRVSATRIYPPNNYPVQLNVTANQDFTGTVTETVPDSFTVTSSNTATTSSYTTMQTVYLDPKTDPAERMIVSVGYSHILVKGNNTSSSTVLGASTSALLLPFIGSFPITEGFGAEQTDPALRLFYEKYGLAGHDGADFGLPVGTPVRAVDDGTILLAGPGDYGITIVIQHSWGKSYYGHLNQVTASFGQHVSKGEQIGFSGNTGEATGPHLHFGMKPNTPDMGNGYYGKIDPLPYFNLPSSAQAADGPAIDAPPALSTVLGASSIHDPLNGASTSAARGNNQLVHDPVTAPQTVSDAVVKPDFRSLTNRLASQILNTPTTANNEKVKIITWNVSLKKGQNVSLGYTFKAPQVSPQFYLLGPLRFYDTAATGSGKPLFEETRQWQIAADRIGDPWYNNGTQYGGYAWQYRKQITIDHTKVVPTYPTAVFMDTPDATNAVAGDNHFELWTSNPTGGGTMTYDTTVLKSGIGSWKANSGASNKNVWLEKDSILADTGTRFSGYFEFPALPASDTEFIGFYNGLHGIFIDISAAGVLEFNDNNTIVKTGSTLSAGTVYRISVAYVITSTSNYTVNVFLNGNSTPDISVTQADHTLSFNAFHHLEVGIITFPGANYVVNFAHVYVDNGTTLDDPGDIRVTAKRPLANGTSNQFTTGIGADPGSPYGSGNAKRENERPLNTANGWSTATITTKQTEEYNIESASAGDVDLTGATLIAEAGWIDAKESSTSHSPVSHIIMNGVATVVTLTASAALYTNIVMNPTYPAGTGTDIGMDGAYSSPGGVYSLYEAGMLIAYTPTTPNQTLSNFPVLISLASDNDLMAKAQNLGGDILFTDSTGQTKYDREIEKYTSATGELEAWVRIPSLSTSADTIIYMYYGNAAASETNSTGVWDSNYKEVLHMGETSGNNLDSTSNGADATPTALSAITGEVDGGQSFNGSTSVATVSNSSVAVTGDKTIEAWINLNSPSSSSRIIADNIDGTNMYQITTCQGGGCGTQSIDDQIDDSGGHHDIEVRGLSNNTWYHVADTFKASGSIHTVYLNGASRNDSSTTLQTPSATGLCIGEKCGTSPDLYTGSLDEIRISNSARTSGWIATEYNNESSPSTFYTLGSTNDIPSGTSVETKAYAPTNDQLMRHGQWFCPQSECGTFYGKQPYVF